MTRPGRLTAALTLVVCSTLGLALAVPGAVDAATKPAPPTITSVAPTTGPTTGGTTVTVSGSSLTQVKKVLFGNTAGSVVHSNGATSLTVTAPPHGAGVVDVVVVTAGGRSAASGGDRFTYVVAAHGATAVTAPIPPGLDPATVNDLDLAAVDCAAPGECRAIGRLVTTPDYLDQLVAERWSRGAWTAVQPPLPADAGAGERASLADVSCAAVDYCVAVGRYREVYPHGARPLIETWDGSSWHATAPVVPADGGMDGFDELTAVSCASPTWCGAVGYYGDADGVSLPLVGTWDGVRWSLRRAAVPGGGKRGGLADVDCPSPATCLAVGWYAKAGQGPLVETFTATGRSAVAPPVPAGGRNAYLGDLSCTAVTTCAATGSDDVGPLGSVRAAGLAEVLGPSGWTPLAVDAPTAPAPDVTATRAVTCWQGTGCLVAGNYFGNDDSDARGPLLSALSGSSGTVGPIALDPATSPGVAYFDAACAVDAHCVSVGGSDNASSTGFVEAVISGQATPVDIALPAGAQLPYAYGVDLDSPTSAVAVGSYYDSGTAPGGSHGLLITGIPVS